MLTDKERELFERFEEEREIRELLRRPVPTSVPGGSETVNEWIAQWTRERELLLRLLARRAGGHQ